MKIRFAAVAVFALALARISCCAEQAGSEHMLPRDKPVRVAAAWGKTPVG